MMTVAIERLLDPCRYDIAERIYQILKEAFSGRDMPFEVIYQAIEKPPTSEKGDYALPCFRLAAQAKVKPDVIVETLKTSPLLTESPWILRMDSIGAFLNLFVHARKWAEDALPAQLDGSYFRRLLNHGQFQEQKVMIEFSQPNTHKEFHVGHGRNVCLGDALVRMYRYKGYPTIAANYPGDEGTHIAKCLWMLQRTGEQPPKGDRGPWLGKMYSHADAALKDADAEQKKEYQQQIGHILAEIESKSGPIFELWQQTRRWSLESFYKIYEFMDVHFDHYFFESEVSEESQKIVDEYLAKGVFIEDQGAIGIDLSGDKLGFAILRKTDGNTLYATKDLALARRKFDEFNVDRSVYVVADEQNLHFRQVFKTLEKMGFAQAHQCFHLSYGMVTLPDGKMSSRKGNSVTFQELIDAISQELDVALEKYRGDWPQQEIDSVRQKLCVGAIRFGMLSTDPVKNIVFNLKDWLSFEGFSGPYLMYTYTRARSILRKAGETSPQLTSENFGALSSPEETELLRWLYDFNQVVSSAGEMYKPSILCHYLYDLCKSFNRFYKNVPVLKTEDHGLKQLRLALVYAFAQTLHQGLKLLGMTPPERM